MEGDSPQSTRSLQPEDHSASRSTFIILRPALLAVTGRFEVAGAQRDGACPNDPGHRENPEKNSSMTRCMSPPRVRLLSWGPAKLLPRRGRPRRRLGTAEAAGRDPLQGMARRGQTI